MLFQSTRPVWGATISHISFQLTIIYFNPRAPCGARRGTGRVKSPKKKFQSTRPVWGATWIYNNQYGIKVFQSTRPVWGATEYGEIGYEQEMISIHAPRVGRDYKGTY